MKWNTNGRIAEAALLALSIVVLGLCIRWGIDDFANKDRKVTVKGLAEKEVDADKVTWPILSKELGNSLPDLYDRIERTQDKIKRFLTDNGIKENEIDVNAPVVIDLNAERYSDNRSQYRYNVTSIITVTSRNVKLVRSIIARQGELLREGVAIVDGGYENPVKYEYVSFTASGVTLNDVNLYPMFHRVSPSDSIQVDAITAMLKKLKVTVTSLVVISDASGMYAMSLLCNSLHRAGIVVAKRTFFSPSLRSRTNSPNSPNSTDTTTLRKTVCFPLVTTLCLCAV